MFKHVFMKRILFYLINKFLTNEERKLIQFGLYSYSDSIGRVKSETCREISDKASSLAWHFHIDKQDHGDPFDHMRFINYYTPLYREQLLLEKDDQISILRREISKLQERIPKNETTRRA
jgi:hypothetical protein